MKDGPRKHRNISLRMSSDTRYMLGYIALVKEQTMTRVLEGLIKKAYDQVEAEHGSSLPSLLGQKYSAPHDPGPDR